MPLDGIAARQRFLSRDQVDPDMVVAARGDPVVDRVDDLARRQRAGTIPLPKCREIKTAVRRRPSHVLTPVIF
jgi:hypothetical protein